MAESQQIETQTVSLYIRRALKTYGSYVLSHRALSEVRDGLKPVHRRVLWEMFRQKIVPKGNFRKCAKIVGATIGNWHPHGDTSVYAALVALAWQRYPLLEGHGNFGSLTDEPAAMRYTEARLSPLAMRLFDDIDSASYIPNYSGDDQEPLALPTRLPILLMNGSEGIAVGLTASLPPHNLGELIEALKHLIRNPEATVHDLMQFIKGPDWENGGVLLSSDDDIEALYTNGVGSLVHRCAYHYEEGDDGENQLVITQVTPHFSLTGNKSFFVKCSDLVQEGVIEYVLDMSGGEGLRIVVGFKDSTLLEQRVLPMLTTSSSYHFHAVFCLGEAELEEVNLYSLTDILYAFIEYRREIVGYVLTEKVKALRQSLLQENARLAATRNIDALAAILKAPSNDYIADIASLLKIKTEQAKYVSSRQLIQMAKGSEQEQLDKIQSLRDAIKATNAELQDIDGVIIRQLEELQPFVDLRRTAVREEAEAAPCVSQFYILCTNDGQLTTMMEPPIKGRFKYNYLIRADELLTYVNSSGYVWHTKTAFVKSGDQEVPDLIGLAQAKHEMLVFLSKLGNIAVVRHPFTAAEYQGAVGSFIQAVGMASADTLIARVGTSFYPLPASTLHPTHRGKAPSRRPGIPTGIEELFVVPSGGVLVSSAGELDITQDFSTTESVYVLGPVDNFVLGASTKGVMTQDRALRLVQNGTVKQVFPL